MTRCAFKSTHAYTYSSLLFFAAAVHPNKSDKCFCGKIKNGTCAYKGKNNPDPTNDLVDIDCENPSQVTLDSYTFVPPADEKIVPYQGDVTDGSYQAADVNAVANLQVAETKSESAVATAAPAGPAGGPRF